MSDVEFIEEKQNQENFQRHIAITTIPVVGSLSRLVQKWGIAKDDKEANRLFVIIIVVCIAITCIIIFVGSSGGSSQVTPAMQAKINAIEAETQQ